MKLPRRLDVGPVRYAVTTDPLPVAKMGDQLGECNIDRATITIDPDQPADVLRESLMHEALHALTAFTGLAGEISRDQEERLVNRLAPALLDTMRRNPKAVAYWMEK